LKGRGEKICLFRGKNVMDSVEPKKACARNRFAQEKGGNLRRKERINNERMDLRKRRGARQRTIGRGRAGLSSAGKKTEKWREVALMKLENNVKHHGQL